MIIKSVEFVISAVKPDQFPIDLSGDIAFAGRSNVGKSSLMNAILGRKRLVKTSSTPGKTRLLNFFLVNNNCYFVDLPGYGYAKVSKSERAKWRPMMESYFRARESISAVVLLVDVRRGLADLDYELLDMLGQYQRPVVIALTKADKLSRGQAGTVRMKTAAELEISPDDIFLCSTLKGDGIERLRETIGQIIFPLGID